MFSGFLQQRYLSTQMENGSCLPSPKKFPKLLHGASDQFSYFQSLVNCHYLHAECFRYPFLEFHGESLVVVLDAVDTEWIFAPLNKRFSYGLRPSDWI